MEVIHSYSSPPKWLASGSDDGDDVIAVVIAFAIASK